jgi:CheY-like chemotaxis protein
VGHGTRTRVLIVEDDENSALGLGAYLELRGFEVTVTTCARDAVRQALSVLPDVIVCDIQMPEMDGIEVAQTLRPIPALRRTRFIAVSGYSDRSVQARAISAGYQQYLIKPFGPGEIESAIAG